jgi:ADP-heptose:LPS heptosyltransferase
VSYQSILIIKRGALGDLLAGTAGIVAIRNQYPRAHICLLSDSLATKVCPEGTIVDEIIDEKAIIKKRLGYLKLWLDIRKRKFDLIINMRWVSEISGFLTLMGNGKHTAGAGPWWLRSLYDFSPPMSKAEANGHEYLLNLNIVQSIGLPTQPPQLFINISEADSRWAEEFFSISKLTPANVLLITPIASTPLKAWPPDRFIAIAKKFIHEMNGRVLITYSPEDEAPANNVVTSIGAGAVLAPLTTVNQLAALTSRVKLCLCNNSGIMHVAYAVATPVVCVNTSIGWAPYGDWNVAVTQLPDQKDQSNNRRLTNEQTHQLLKQISVETVWEALATKWKSLNTK